MAHTELFEMSNEERLKAIKEMETGLLFAELDDTIQIDILKVGATEWDIKKRADKKVYRAIINELRDRLRKGK